MSQKHNAPRPRPPAIERRLKSVREPAMRRAAMAEYIGATPPRDVTARVGAWIARANSDDGATVALDALAAALSSDELVAYEVRRSLYDAATEAELPHVARLLFSYPVVVADASILARDIDDERPLRPRGRPLTLGERKSLARGHRRDSLELLLLDPHPAVVEILLANPHITERDVLAIASRRPSMARALAAVFESPRWSVRYPIKRALVLNPFTPVPVSARLMTTLRAADLSEVSRDANLHPGLQEHAAQILEQRRG